MLAIGAILVVLALAVWRAQPSQKAPTEGAKKKAEPVSRGEVERMVYNVLGRIQDETEQRERQMQPQMQAPPPMMNQMPPSAPSQPQVVKPRVLTDMPEANVTNPGPPMKFGDDVPVTAERAPL